MAFRAAFYKGTHPGLPGVYNRLVRAWERGPYSHVELIFSDGWAASSSWMDGGVRFKRIEFDAANWDFVDLPWELEAAAREYFMEHDAWRYDLMGNFNHIVGFVSESPNKLFCSEAVAEALGFSEGWRFGPNVLARALSTMFAHSAHMAR